MQWMKQKGGLFFQNVILLDSHSGPPRVFISNDASMPFSDFFGQICSPSSMHVQVGWFLPSYTASQVVQAVDYLPVIMLSKSFWCSKLNGKVATRLTILHCTFSWVKTSRKLPFVPFHCHNLREKPLLSLLVPFCQNFQVRLQLTMPSSSWYLTNEWMNENL